MKTKQGISLIVLVITIIVMTVLAGAIVLTLNNSGIIAKAENAVEQSNLATVKEVAQMAWADAYIKYGENQQKLETAVKSSLEENDISEEDYMGYMLKITLDGIELVAAHNGKTIPEGGVYYVGVTEMNINPEGYENYVEKYEGGDEFPELTQGDIYVYEDYEYRYQYRYASSSSTDFKWTASTKQIGWCAKVKNTEKKSYTDILHSVNGSDVTDLECTFKDCINLTKIPHIPEGVTDMSNAFYGCVSITDDELPNIPNGTTSVYRLFSGCTSLVDASSISFPNSVTNMFGVFENCTSLEKAPSISNNATTIQNMFVNCVELTDISKVVLPDSLVNMEQAFKNCSKLSNIGHLVVPSNVENMFATFRDCTALVDISNMIISTTKTTLSQTFFGCTSLKRVPKIPNGITNMTYTFYKCTALTGDINIDATPTTYTNCFYNVDFAAQNLTLSGDSLNLSELGATGLNYQM